MNTLLPFRVSVTAFFLLGAVLVQAAFEFGNNSLVLEQFRTRGQSADGKGRWILAGTQARLDGPVVHLSNAKLVYTDTQGDTTTITSPSASFNRADQRGHSTAPLRLENRQLIVTGVGYDLLANQHKLFIRSQVHMTFKQRADSPLGTALKAQLTPTPPVEKTPP